MPDYIPTADADFDNWLGRFAAYVNANASVPATYPRPSWTPASVCSTPPISDFGLNAD